MSGDGAAALSHDANGNLTSDGSTAYVYDAENRLVRASGATNATLSYDPMGRLWQVSGGAGTTRFMYDGDRLIAEYNGAGTLLRRYVHGPGVDEPLVWYEGAGVGAGSRRYLHADHQGSVIAVSDASGAVLGVNRYDPYGVPAASNLGRFGYTGQTRIGELGLSYYKARIYSPVLGRFLQTDPIGYDDDLNLYAYVQNDPLNRVDPTGMAGEGVGCGTRISGANSAMCIGGGNAPAEAATRRTASAPSAATASAPTVEPSVWDVLTCNKPDCIDATPEVVVWAAGPVGGIVGAVVGSALRALGLGGAAARGLTHWGNSKTLADHFARHGKDFGAKSADDYAKQASDFFRRSQTDRLPTKIDADGVIRVYDPRSNTFGAFNPDGTTRTFFKPTSPTYFDRQPGGAP